MLSSCLYLLNVDNIITGGTGIQILRPIQILRLLMLEAKQKTTKKKELKAFYGSRGVEQNIFY
jgi:hypothetical protein